MQLKELTVGKKSRIIKLLAKGIQRRRLLDLGIIPGTEVIVKRRSPSGDPTAYLIKGSHQLRKHLREYDNYKKQKPPQK